MNEQVAPHEAGAGRFTPANAAEMGARGAAKRERNLRDRVSETKQELAIHAEEAARTLGAILKSDARDADKVKAAVAILDRVGVGPHASKDVNIGTSLIEQWAAELQIIQDEGGLENAPAIEVEPHALKHAPKSEGRQAE